MWPGLLLATTCWQKKRTWAPQRGTFAARSSPAMPMRDARGVAVRGKTVVPLAAVSAEDGEFLRNWRGGPSRAAADRPACLAAVACQAWRKGMTVRKRWRRCGEAFLPWEARTFHIGWISRSQGIVRDLAARFFEGTRAVVQACDRAAPRGVNPRKYQVRLSWTPRVQSGWRSDGQRRLFRRPRNAAHAANHRHQAGTMASRPEHGRIFRDKA